MFGCDYMNISSDNIKKNELFNILSSIKMTLLLFSVILFISQHSLELQSDTAKVTDYINLNSITLFIISFITVYFIWYFFSIKSFQSLYYKILVIVENFIFIAVFSMLIVYSNSGDSPYKLLFIFIIIISTLQLGINYGVTIAITSSIIILTIDLIYGKGSLVNIQFQKDLILMAIFISIAATLGHYVKFENESLMEKNLHLQALSNEIEEINRHRKHIEKILLNNDLCYNLLFKSSGNAVIVHRDNSIIYANESAAKLLGFEMPEKLTGMSLLDFMEPQSKVKTETNISNLDMQALKVTIFESTLTNCHNKNIDVQNTSTKFIYDGKPAILSIFNDITSNKQVEKLQKDVEKNIELLNETREVNRLITEFFSNISHELKTPLNVIYSAIQVLDFHRKMSKEGFLEKHDKYSRIIKQNCFRLMRLINNLLDLTRLDSGFLKLNLENYDIVSVVENISLSVVTYMESKGLNLIFDTDTEEKIMAVDPDKIERIILNLLSNACKFTNPGGEISVTITDLGEEVAISVKDTGIGIPSDKLDMIFERFGQVDKTLKRFHEGTGIGLSLVKSFVEMHGGKIIIKSTLGLGSEFIIYLPAKVLENDDSDINSIYENNIERINIEFSDIYSDDN